MKIFSKYYPLLMLLMYTPVTMSNIADDIPVVSSGEIKFYMDYSTFTGINENTSVEFYLMFYADNFSSVIIDGKETIKYKAELSVYLSEELLVKKDWITEAVITEGSNTLIPDVIYEQFKEELEAGTYTVSIKVSDENSLLTGEADAILIVPSYKNNMYTVSSLQFIYNVSNDTLKNDVKTGKSITSNPSRRYGVLNPILYFYYELYNLPGVEGDIFNSRYSITKDDVVIKSLPEETFIKSSESYSFMRGINTAALKTGIYNLTIETEHRNTGIKTTTGRKFEVLQADYSSDQIILTEEDIEDGSKLIKHISTPEQYNQFSKLNNTGKSQFLINFWKNTDPSPGTPENEYLNKIRDRFNYANKNFGWAGVEGWSTERGRVLIKYGMPDETERYNSESGTAPYEIWIYREERYFYFVFGDIRSDGRYILLHSDKEGEIYNERWKEQIQRM